MTVTVFPITVGTNDGGGQYASAAWPPNGGTFSALNGGRDYVVKQHNAAPSYEQYWVCLRWDTSSIPDTDVIVSAQLQFFIFSGEVFINNPGTYTFQAGWYEYGGNPMVAADWIEFETTPIFDVSLATLTANAFNTINITDLSGINQSGFTGMRLNLSSGTPPLNAAGGDGIRVEMFDVGGPAPALMVTHQVPASIAWVDA